MFSSYIELVSGNYYYIKQWYIIQGFSGETRLPAAISFVDNINKRAINIKIDMEYYTERSNKCQNEN